MSKSLWTGDDLRELTSELLASLGDTIGFQIVPLDYSGIDNPDDQQTEDFLWVRFRNESFTDPPEILAVAGAVHASLKTRIVSGFLQWFVNGTVVRSRDESDMLIPTLTDVATNPSWGIEWEPHDFVEEYDQYTYDYFMSLGKLKPNAGADSAV